MPTKSEISEALKRAMKTDEEKKNARPGDVKASEKGWTYTWFDPSTDERGMTVSRLRSIRENLLSKGYGCVVGEPAGKDQGQEYVHGCSNAEIWRCPDEVAAYHFEQRKKKHAERMALH